MKDRMRIVHKWWHIILDGPDIYLRNENIRNLDPENAVFVIALHETRMLQPTQYEIFII